MRSKVVDKMLKEIDKWPWYKKLLSNIRLEIWVWKNLSRKYWDKSFEGYVFKKKPKLIKRDPKEIEKSRCKAYKYLIP